jgi:RNA polymerase sigma factor (sigma-70 family)
MNDDAELLRQYAAENSQAAFAELVRRHVDLVFSAALHKVGRDVHAAEDVAQTVFLALARQARALANRRTVAGWLYVTAQHHAAQYVRAERRREIRETRAHIMNEILNTPDVDWHRLRPLLDDSLRELSDTEREVILLRYLEGQPFATIGRTFQVSEDAARMRADRALEKLRTLLARRGFSSTAAALAGVLGQQVAAAPASLAGAIATSVAALPAMPSKSFMSMPQLLTGGAVVAAAIALFLARSNDRSPSEPPAPSSRSTNLPALTASTPPPAIPVAGAGSVRAALPTRLAPSQTEEREPRDSEEARRATFERQLRSYTPLLDKLNLTTEQRTTFNQLLAANLQRHADIGEVGRTRGTRPVDVDIEALGAEADAELSARVRASFGPAVANALEHFNQTGPVREFVHHLADALAATTEPLAPAQREQLVELIARHSHAIDGRIQGSPRDLDIEAAIRDGENPLSPLQVAVLRQLRASLR